MQQGEGLENCHQPDIVMKVPVKRIQEPVGPFKNGKIWMLGDLDTAPSSATDLLQVHGQVTLLATSPSLPVVGLSY